MQTLIATQNVLFRVLHSRVDKDLFLLLQSTPQVTDQECLMIFYASTVLLDIYKIRAMKYGPAEGTKVDAALSVARKNLRTNQGFLAEELLELLTKLRACCKPSGMSLWSRALTWT